MKANSSGSRDRYSWTGVCLLEDPDSWPSHRGCRGRPGGPAFKSRKDRFSANGRGYRRLLGRCPRGLRGFFIPGVLAYGCKLISEGGADTELNALTIPPIRLVYGTSA
ncbi:hypothetical protein CC2G_011510 [Coprinopsis cinerea AmutBmut pab1-1]|nr:hypothetical protein CC2G_011510 [Coprinopsis cinerea AmutBmut pab1-1]